MRNSHRAEVNFEDQKNPSTIRIHPGGGWWFSLLDSVGDEMW
jgi:hypothetical protein